MSQERPSNHELKALWSHPSPLGSDVITVITREHPIGSLTRITITNQGVGQTIFDRGLRCIIQNPYQNRTIIFFTDENDHLVSATYRSDKIEITSIISNHPYY